MATIKNCKPRLISLPGGADRAAVMLLPGVNTIDDGAWHHWSGHRVIKALIADGDLEVVDMPAAPIDGASELAAISAKDSKALVRDTVDRALLLRWLDGESRKSVIEALSKQIEAVSVGPANDDGGE